MAGAPQQGPLELPFVPNGYDPAYVLAQAMAYAQQRTGYVPHMVMQEGTVTYDHNGVPGVYIKYLTPEGPSTEWTPLPPEPQGWQAGAPPRATASQPAATALGVPPPPSQAAGPPPGAVPPPHAGRISQSPQAIQQGGLHWYGQTYTDPADFERALVAHGGNYDTWARNHPGAAAAMGHPAPHPVHPPPEGTGPGPVPSGALPPAQHPVGLGAVPPPQHPIGFPPSVLAALSQHPVGLGAIPGAQHPVGPVSPPAQHPVGQIPGFRPTNIDTFQPRPSPGAAHVADIVRALLTPVPRPPMGVQRAR